MDPKETPSPPILLSHRVAWRLQSWLIRRRKTERYGRRLFLSSTFEEMGPFRSAVLSKLRNVHGVTTYEPGLSDEIPLVFMDEVSAELTQASYVVLLLGRSPGTPFGFLRGELLTPDEVARHVERLRLPDRVLNAPDEYTFSTGESFTEVESRYYLERPSHRVWAFVDREWVAQAWSRIDEWEARGIFFGIPHVGDSSCRGGCWAQEGVPQQSCRVDYYVRSQGVELERDNSPAECWLDDLTDDDWVEVSWLQFTCDIMAHRYVKVSAFDNVDGLSTKVATAVAAQILRDRFGLPVLALLVALAIGLLGTSAIWFPR